MGGRLATIDLVVHEIDRLGNISVLAAVADLVTRAIQ
jgi:hypothetical protein